MPKFNEHLLLKPTAAIVRDIIRTHYGRTLRTFEIPKKGFKNTTVLVATDCGPAVLRVYPRDKRDPKILREFAFMEYLAERGIPVPRILPAVNGEKIARYRHRRTFWKCMLAVRLPGGHPRVYRRRLLSQLARMQARMHEA